ncbi:MAG: amidohydrolase family protein [Flavobacteriaceae bacterium]|nr:amidohydrolase family protein [Flavobacteriaceae bacterium]MCY4266294.1 amidohydrolase family protein [Flavobacteriaceae bacterium]MCY4299809.1 amidohydrolase family protein [Flavobacteriaceae bacterium]
MIKKLVYGICLLPILSNAQKTYIHAGELFDSENGKILKEQTIIIQDNLIESVEDGYLTPEDKNIKVVDLNEKTVYPGFIDLHVHIESESNPNAYLQRFQLNPADIAFNSTVFALTTLKAGFTTVRDVGGTGVNIAIRNAINAGKVRGPRIFTSGKIISSTGGHGDPTNGFRDDIKGDPGPKQGVVNSVDDAKKAVRQRYKNGADLIKITATGGVISVAKSGQNPQFFENEIKAIVDTATDYGMKVAAHAHGDEGIARAVRAGVTTIEHGTLMSDSTMALMVERNVYLVPTITAGKSVAEYAKIPGYYPAIVVPKAIAIGAQIQDTFGKAYKRGVPIAFGTDAGVFPHGDNAKEFFYMVEAGMPNVEALQSATITAARLLDQENTIGQIAPGYYADIVASDENALDNIKTLQKITFVMKDGKIYKHK